MWCRLVYCLLYSSLLILQTRCFFFFFQWKVLTGEIFKVVLKANKPFLKNVHVLLVLPLQYCCLPIMNTWILFAEVLIIDGGCAFKMSCEYMMRLQK